MGRERPSTQDEIDRLRLKIFRMYLIIQLDNHKHLIFKKYKILNYLKQLKER